MTSQYFQHHFLLAMPNQVGTYFGGTITYLCVHDAKGAFGLMINRPTSLSLVELLGQMQCPTAVDPSQIVLEGGPVELERGFVLHSDDIVSDTTQVLSDGLALSTSKEILDLIGSGEGPKRYLVTLGYAGWGEGQLEQEIAQNAWLTCPADEDIVFTGPLDTKVDRAAATLGIDFRMMSPDMGQA